MAVDPRDPAVLYVATHGGLVRVAAGTRWTYVSDDRSDLMGFTMHPEEQGVIFVSGHPDLRSGRPNPMGVLVSRDGGRTWRPLALEGAADMHAMTFSLAENALYGWNVMGKDPGLYRVSVDGGRTVRLRPQGLEGAYALAAHPREKGRLLAGTQDGLKASSDGGTIWHPVPGPLLGAPVTAVAYHPADATRLYAYAIKESVGLARSTDGGKTWTPTGLFVPGRDAVVVIAPSPHAAGTVFIATAGGDILRSGDGGTTWTPLAKAGRPLAN